MAGKAERARVERMVAALDRADALIEALGRQGLQRASRSSSLELRSLAQIAHAAGLVRIEREIGALDTHVVRYLDADPLFRTEDYLGALNRIWLLVGRTRARLDEGATPSEMLDLLGEARRRYEAVEAPLQVAPLGASGWVTDTGFLGITVWLASGAELLQAAIVRPVAGFGREPRRLLFQPPSDLLDLTLFDLAHAPHVLVDARRSSDGRLGLHRDLGVGEAPDPGLAVYEPWRAERWTDVLTRLGAADPSPLAEAPTALVYVEPRRWGDLTLDDKRARARLPLFDDQGAEMWVQARLAPENELLVDNLTALQGEPRARPRGLFGRARLGGGELRFEPFTAVYDPPVRLRIRRERKARQVHLGLEPLDRVEFA